VYSDIYIRRIPRKEWNSWPARSCLSTTSHAHCNRLQQTATHCNRLPQTAADCNKTATDCNRLQQTATHCSTLHRTATDCNRLLHTATHSNTQQHTATHSNTLQHTATHCLLTRIELQSEDQQYIVLRYVDPGGLIKNGQSKWGAGGLIN